MKIKAIIILQVFLMQLSILFSVLCMAGGSTVGNGGAFIKCKGDSNFIFIDRLVYFEKMELLMPADDWQNNLFSIANTLGKFQDKKLKELSKNLAQFVQHAFIEYSKQFPWVWINQSEPLPIMANPWFDGKLPRSCTQVFQAVIRFGMSERDPNIRFLYSENLIQTVLAQKGGSLEISFLILHEWLWTYFENKKDPLYLAKVNQLLHSTQFKQLKVTEVLKLF